MSSERTTGSVPGAARGPGPARSIRELGVLNWGIARIGARVTGRKTLGVFQTIGRAKRLFRGWLVYSAMMMPFGYLSRVDTEAIILRVAHVRGSAYEADQHRDIAARAGLSRAEIMAIESDDHGFTGRRGVLLDAVDELVETRSLAPETWHRLSGELSKKEQVAFVMLVTNYDGLATALDVLEVPVDVTRT
ncbi:MAG TPA: carboxymuconolactone decarboxylase family protein [Candidatus Corynebacterium gallistercoris]|uniref:Carboxymuconolactone decarboxylase family protein n=1 Tax=Candidatus Corynebacterium gallistercoris TaxID=2838530 RepID=A0A9D1RZ92_9CORY|nr:carboxymuconolactone decarboxylase family protein [Candidatus Corynebacterium gallistercoris]